MPFNSTNVANMALSLLGAQQVSDIATDNSAAGASIRAFQEAALRGLIRSHRLWFTEKTVTLALLGEDLNPEWKYSYRRPSEAEDVHRILSGRVRDDEDSRIPFALETDAAGGVILTNEAAAKAKISFLPTDLAKVPADFILAYAAELAFWTAAAPGLSNDDLFGFQQRMAAIRDQALSRALANAANEEQPVKRPENSFLRARR